MSRRKRNQGVLLKCLCLCSSAAAPPCPPPCPPPCMPLCHVMWSSRVRWNTWMSHRRSLSLTLSVCVSGSMVWRLACLPLQADSAGFKSQMNHRFGASKGQQICRWAPLSPEVWKCQKVKTQQWSLFSFHSLNRLSRKNKSDLDWSINSYEFGL